MSVSGIPKGYLPGLSARFGSDDAGIQILGIRQLAFGLFCPGINLIRWNTRTITLALRYDIFWRMIHKHFDFESRITVG